MANPSWPLLGVAYFGNRYPHHARADLQAIAAAGADRPVRLVGDLEQLQMPRLDASDSS